MARHLFKRTTTALSPSPSDEQDHAFQRLVKAVDEHRALSGSGGSVGRAAVKAVRARRAQVVQHRAFRKQLVRLLAPAILRPLPEGRPLARSNEDRAKGMSAAHPAPPPHPKMRTSSLRRK